MVDKSVRQRPSDYRLTQKKRRKTFKNTKKRGRLSENLIREANN